MVITVVGPQSSVATLCEHRFAAIAVDLIQPYRPLSTSKNGPMWCSQHPPTAQLSTHHLGIDQVPAIITNCGPLALEEDLHPAWTGALPSIHQADLPLSGWVVVWSLRSGRWITGMTCGIIGCIRLRYGRFWFKSLGVHPLSIHLENKSHLTHKATTGPMLPN